MAFLGFLALVFNLSNAWDDLLGPPNSCVAAQTCPTEVGVHRVPLGLKRGGSGGNGCMYNASAVHFRSPALIRQQPLAFFSSNINVQINAPGLVFGFFKPGDGRPAMVSPSSDRRPGRAGSQTGAGILIVSGGSSCLVERLSQMGFWATARSEEPRLSSPVLFHQNLSFPLFFRLSVISGDRAGIIAATGLGIVPITVSHWMMEVVWTEFGSQRLRTPRHPTWVRLT